MVKSQLLPSLVCLVLLLVDQAAGAFFPLPQSIFGSSSSQASVSSTSLVRLRANRLRRPESCRENLPRKAADLPALVIVGRVKEVYLAGEAAAAALPAQQVDQTQNTNKALVTVGRVIRGNQQLAGSDILISGFNSTSSQPCPNYVKHNDTLILLLEPESGGERRYAIQGSNLLSMNLANLDRISAIAADEPLRRRAPIEDILCEAQYCAYGRCRVINERTTTCHCPDSCPALPAPVCGSDNATYPNECHLIKEGCRRQKPLFVTKESSC